MRHYCNESDFFMANSQRCKVHRFTGDDNNKMSSSGSFPRIATPLARQWLDPGQSPLWTFVEPNMRTNEQNFSSMDSQTPYPWAWTPEQTAVFSVTACFCVVGIILNLSVFYGIVTRKSEWWGINMLIGFSSIQNSLLLIFVIPFSSSEAIAGMFYPTAICFIQ